MKLTASRILGPTIRSASLRDVVVHLVREAEPYFHALRCELVEHASNIIRNCRGDLRECKSRRHDGWDKNSTRGNNIGHDAQQLVA